MLCLDAESLLGDKGAKLAYWSDSWGIIPGCNDYAGYVTLRIYVERARFDAASEVSTKGSWVEEARAEPGDSLEMRITYSNNSDHLQKSVTVYDKLSRLLEAVPGSVRLVDDENPKGMKLDDSLFGDGLVIGDYGPGERATVEYRVRLKDSIEAEGATYNDVSVATEDGTVRDRVRIVLE